MKVFILFVSCALLAGLVHGVPPKNQGKAVGKPVQLPAGVKSGAPKTVKSPQPVVSNGKGVGKPVQLPAGVKSGAPKAVKSPQPVVSGLDKLMTKLIGNLQEELNNSVDDLMSALHKIMSKLEIPIDDESYDDDSDSVSAAPVAAVKGSKN